jgi:hypothetical protein
MLSLLNMYTLVLPMTLAEIIGNFYPPITWGKIHELLLEQGGFPVFIKYNSLKRSNLLCFCLLLSLDQN